MGANFNLSDLKFHFFSTAEKYFINTLIAKLCLTIVNFLVIFFLKGDNIWSSWITVLIILSVSLLDYILGWYYSKNKEKAEKLREYEFYQVNLHLEPDPEDLSGFYLDMPDKYKSDSKSLNPKFKEGYFENENLRLNLLENIYVTAQNFKQNFNYHIKWLIGAGIIIVAFLFVFFILYTFEIPLASLETSGPQILLIAITSLIAYNFIDIALSFHTKSKQLVILFNRLSDLEGNTNKIIACLIEYNLILNSSYSTISKIYTKNHDHFLVAWSIRKHEILHKISADQIGQNINNNCKLLFDKSLHFDCCVTIGSYSAQIEVAGKSDLDILLVFERGNLDSLKSTVFYQSVFAKLKLLYGDNLIESTPSFIIQNFGELTIELTPCFKKDDSTYQIANPKGEWDDIQPQKTNEHFREFNEKSEGRFYKILRVLKEWRYENKIIIVHSIYIQTLLYNVMTEGIKKSEQEILLIFYERLKMLNEIKDPISSTAVIKPLKVSDDVNLSNLEEINKAISQIKQMQNGK